MIFKIFGYYVNIFREFKVSQPRISPAKCEVRRSGEYFILCDPEGKHLPVQTKMTIVNNLREPSKATVELFVDISNIDLEPIPRHEKTTIPHISDRLN